MEDNWEKALKISFDIWNEYLSSFDNGFNLKVFEFLLVHYFLSWYEEIAKEYNIPINDNNKIELVKKCFQTFSNKLIKELDNYEIVIGNLKESD